MKTKIITAFFCCISFTGFTQSKAFQAYQDSVRTVFNPAKILLQRLNQEMTLQEGIPILIPTQPYIMPNKRSL